MSPDTVFDIINASVLPAWLLLWFAPRARITEWVAHSLLYPVALGLAYVGMISYVVFADIGGEGTDFLSLAGVMAIFSTPWGVTIGWAHFLVFDLFVGAWEGRDARRHGLAHWLVAPCQFLTFMAGPLGLLLYLGARRKMLLGEQHVVR